GTGTNGKTTTVNMLRHVLDGDSARSASIGTLGIAIGSEAETLAGGGGLTTPGPVELQRVFRALLDAGVRRVAMEVSSHSLDQRRVEGVSFDVGVFTNLTRDHLDYHGTMEKYFAAKSQLIEHLRPHGTVVYNLDDPAWAALKTERRRVSFSERVMTAGVHAAEVKCKPRGSDGAFAEGGKLHPCGSQRNLCLAEEGGLFPLPLIGDFNVINALGAAAAAYSL